ncbi:MAG: saccharopine dehydrogenase NADP-binding domain-containing protein [Hyphomicrobiales bacterium]
MNKVLILGGYGNFGKRIAFMLTRQNIPVIIAGRDREKAQALLNVLPPSLAEIAVFDVDKSLSEKLRMLNPAVVINTCGPFQNRDYSAAKTCIAHGIHYIDLADGRDFVAEITALDADAKDHDVTVISGASTVPGLTSAVIEHYLPEFAEISLLQYGIAPGQKAERGLATTQAILGYVGKRLKPCAGFPVRYGWQDLYVQNYPQLGRRWMANCEIPDLDLLPAKYGIKRIRFSAGMENPLLHLGVWTLSWMVRIGIPLYLPRYAAVLLKISNWFDIFGSADGGMHVTLRGTGKSGTPLAKNWFIIARDGDGPYIPAVPAVILAKKLIGGQFFRRGAMACMGLFSLDEYLKELEHLRVATCEQ